MMVELSFHLIIKMVNCYSASERINQQQIMPKSLNEESKVQHDLDEREESNLMPAALAIQSLFCTC